MPADHKLKTVSNIISRGQGKKGGDNDAEKNPAENAEEEPAIISKAPL